MTIHPGQRFGRWTVIEQAPGRYHEQILWLCRCDCGTIRAVPAHSLTSGRSRSCGCLSADTQRARAEDLTGQRFGRLTVMSKLDSKRWLCRCDCGKEVPAVAAYMRYGRTASCGCARVERTQGMEEGRQLGCETRRALLVDGTALDEITPDRRLNKNSKTGVRGVSLTKDGRYRATIVLRRKQYDLGIYTTVEAAAGARAEAEERLYKPILEEHKKSAE